MDQIFICTPDKDLGQCVVGTRVVESDRRRDIVRDEAGVVANFGVKPRSIPDYLAVVGDSRMASQASQDGARRRQGSCYLNTPTWKTFQRLAGMAPSISRARGLSESLFGAWNDALLFRTLATLRLDVPVFDSVDDLRWKGPSPPVECIAGG